MNKKETLQLIDTMEKQAIEDSIKMIKHIFDRYRKLENEKEPR